MATPFAQQKDPTPQRAAPDGELKPVLPPIGSEPGKIVADAKSAIEESQRSRDARFLSLWFRCAAFYQGCQQGWSWGGWQQGWTFNPRIPTQTGTIRLTENRVQPSIDQMVAIMCADPVRLSAPPATPDYDDVNRAEVATALLRTIRDDEITIPSLDPIVKLWKALCGIVVLDMGFDTEAGPYSPDIQPDGMGGFAQATDEAGKGIFTPQGRLFTELYTAPQVLWDLDATGPHDAEGQALGTLLSKSTIERRWGIVVNSDAYTPNKEGFRRGIYTHLSETLRRMFSFVGPNASWFGYDLPFGTMIPPHGIEVWKFYTAPCPDYPSGRCTVIAGDQLAYDDHAQTEGIKRFPSETFYHLYDGKNPYGMGIVQQVIPLQEQLNSALSALAMKDKINLNPRVLLPKDCKVAKEAFTSNPREIIEYVPSMNGGKPEYLPAPGIHPAEFQFVNDKRAQIDWVVGLGDAAHGINPPGVRAGQQLEFLKSQSSQRLKPIVDRDRIAYREMGRFGLFLLGRYWPDGKIVSAIGKDLQPFVVEFKKSDFAEPFDIVVENGISLPEDPVDRANALTSMFQQMQNMDPEWRRYYMELMNVGDIRRLMDDENRQHLYTRAKYLKCLQGEFPPFNPALQYPMAPGVEYFEDAFTAIRVLKRLMTTQDFYSQPQQIQAMVAALNASYCVYTRGSVPLDQKGNPLPPGSMTPEAMQKGAEAGAPAQPQGSPPAPVMAPQ